MELADAMVYRARKIQYMWENDDSDQSFFARDYWVGSFDFMSRPLFQRRWILEELVSTDYSLPCRWARARAEQRS